MKETKLIVISENDSPIKGLLSCDNEEPSAIIQGTADIANVSGDSRGPMVTDDLDIADELSAISMN